MASHAETERINRKLMAAVNNNAITKPSAENLDINGNNQTTLTKSIKPVMFNPEKYLDDEEYKIEWGKSSSQFAKLTNNPVRRLVEQMKIEPNPSLQMIALSIGDPVILSNLGKPDIVKEAVVKCLDDKKI